MAYQLEITEPIAVGCVALPTSRSPMPYQYRVARINE